MVEEGKVSKFVGDEVIGGVGTPKVCACLQNLPEMDTRRAEQYS